MRKYGMYIWVQHSIWVDNKEILKLAYALIQGPLEKYWSHFGLNSLSQDITIWSLLKTNRALGVVLLLMSWFCWCCYCCCCGCWWCILFSSPLYFHFWFDASKFAKSNSPKTEVGTLFPEFFTAHILFWELYVLDLKTKVFCRKEIQLLFPMDKGLTVPI